MTVLLHTRRTDNS